MCAARILEAASRKGRRRTAEKGNRTMPCNSTRLLAGSLLVASLASVAHAADANHGERLAKRWCAACHIVAPDQRSGADNVPSFASVARRPDFTAAKLAFFLRDPHPKMPNMGLSRGEADDIAAYIAGLGR
jgi:mono/diheme cytochrome c family protein